MDALILYTILGIFSGIFIIKLFTNYSINSNLHSSIQILVRQAARWSTAANQDQNPMIAVLHANYGAGYLWALKDIATDDQIKKATNIDIIKFKDEIIKTQDNATKKMIKVCPDFGPVSTYLTKIGGEGI